ncbi:MAG TPA: hypothetical protein VEQ59_09430, partial [Polyangiaceae bacterium]|nr:hypothetical protein [Polyangiaceae bacterium]
MKKPLLTPLSVLLLAVSASAVTLDAPAGGAQSLGFDAPGLDAERELSVLERKETSFKQELAALARDSELLRA